MGEVREHLRLMDEAGLIVADFVHGDDLPRVLRVTQEGHDFAELVRDPKRWSRVSAKVQQVGSAPFDVWIELLRRDIAEELEEES